jgi:hypothetical protein
MSGESEAHTAAGNLLVAFYVRSQIMGETQSAVIASERFAALCEAGVRAGLAQSAAQLELLVLDVVEQLPPAKAADRGGIWIWLMQARWILARRLGGSEDAAA